MTIAPYPGAKKFNGLYRYTEREWFERKFLPSFGLIGNQGHAVWIKTIFGMRLCFYNVKNPNF